MIRLLKFFAVLPLWFAHGTGLLLGWLVFLCSASYRSRFLSQARQAAVARRDWLRAVGEAGKLVAELPRLWFGPAASVTWIGSESIEKAMAEGRGVIFLTPHLGSFEVTAQAYAQKFGADKPMTVLYRPPRQHWLRPVMAQVRARPGLKTAQTSLGGVRQLTRALRAGQCVGLLPDQVPPQGQGVWAPFFGREAYTMTLAVRLARQTGAAVLLAWGDRLPRGGGYQVQVHALTQAWPEDIEQGVRAMNAELERMVLGCPHQYLWGYARYKQPREDAST